MVNQTLAVNRLATPDYFINQVTLKYTGRKLIGIDLSRLLSPSYVLWDFWEENGDERVKHLPLIGGGPWGVLFIVFAYWFLVRVLLPKMMNNRAPFELRAAMLLHNSFLIGINGVGVFICLYITKFMYLTWTCTKSDFKDVPDWQYEVNVYLGYFYFLSKIVDFSDTFFFVLRKRYNQASFLHVFHHGMMPFAAYLGLKFAPDFYSGFLPLLNSAVHAVMYSYYALACAGKDLYPYIWWKKYMTQIQMTQFVMICCHAIHSIVNRKCEWPLIFGILEAFQSIFFFFLFYGFYRASFHREQQRIKAAAKLATDANNNLIEPQKKVE